MGEIDRRALIGAAGATVALAACSKEGAGGTEAVRNSVCLDLPESKSGLTIFGTGIPHEVPNIPVVNGRRHPKGARPTDYKPQYACLVYLKFSDNKLYSNYGHFMKSTFALSGKSIKDQFDNISSGNNWLDAERQGNNFDEFSFGRQHDIYFFLDNGNDIVFDPENLIQFTQYGIKRDVNGSKPLKYENNSFLNAEILTNIYPGKNVLHLENWYTDKVGKKCEAKYDEEKTHHLYSFNIHLLMAVGAITATKTIPIVIDPDGGNMGSQP